MPARKTAKKSTKRSSKTKAAQPDTGPVPPYGEAIRGAMARGDTQEMKNVAASARKWITDAQSALTELESALKPKKK
ncbi:MAG TPA: DUF1843 domain-containing protein [Pyrinomonadaceae bacterium]|nr:DUF1843 domain-containing protein [Pyrinomonadaceae bacterium]